MNTLNIDLGQITVNLPPTLMIIEKDKYNDLVKRSEQGRYLSLNDVLEMLSVSRPWLIENVLSNPKYKNKIDIDLNNKGFVKYPKSQGGKYLFLASRTQKFFEENFSDILKEKC